MINSKQNEEIDVSGSNRKLSKAFVKKYVNDIFDDVEAYKRWGAVEIIFKAGCFKMIKKEESIITEPK